MLRAITCDCARTRTGASSTLVEKIANNQLSPIAYYLEKRMMDIKLLSQYTDILRWRVKRHLKPNVFKKLSHEILKKYADAFEITVDELLNF